jgi:hypothetical protein
MGITFVRGVGPETSQFDSTDKVVLWAKDESGAISPRVWNITGLVFAEEELGGGIHVREAD